jgi:hypothetical protein
MFTHPVTFFQTPAEEDRLFLVDDAADSYYELDLDTLLVINGPVSAGSFLHSGMGCVGERLYACQGNNVVELNLDTLAVINGPTATGFSVGGIGGTATQLNINDDTNNLTKTVNKDTLAVGSPQGGDGLNFPTGIGGTSNRLYWCGGSASPNRIYEISTTTFADISSGGVASPGSNTRGIGGTTDRLYNCDNGTDKIYELDPDTMIDISGGGVVGPSTLPRGIGGTKK